MRHLSIILLLLTSSLSFSINTYGHNGKPSKKELEVVEIKDALLFDAFKSLFEERYTGENHFAGVVEFYSLCFIESDIQSKYLVYLGEANLDFDGLRYCFRYKGAIIVMSKNIPLSSFKLTGRKFLYSRGSSIPFVDGDGLPRWYQMFYYWPYKKYQIFINRSL